MARLTIDEQREGLRTLHDLAMDCVDEWEEFVDSLYGLALYSEEDKRAYRERVRVARETYKALLARLDASGEE